MKRFRHLIERHESEYGKLHALVRATFARRAKSELARRDWKIAARRFREYRSEVDVLLKRCLAEGIADDNELKIFTFCYVECDPYYIGSGYAMEGLLRKIKKLSLAETEKTLLQNLVIKRIDTKALRNFRQICRLIPTIETQNFRSEVAERTRSRDASVRHRAKFAFSYFPPNSRLIDDEFVAE